MNITINHIISLDAAALAVLSRLPAGPVVHTSEPTVAVPDRLLAPPTRGRPPKKVETSDKPPTGAPPEEQEAPPGDPGKVRQALRVIIDRGLTADLQEGKGPDGKPIVRRRDAIKAYLAEVAPECNGRLRDVPDDKLGQVSTERMNEIVASAQ